MAQQKLSSVGLDFIKGFETFVGYVYDDKRPMVGGKYREWKGGTVVGTLTIGYGHTDAAAHPLKIKKGLRITEKKAREILDVDLDECEADVARHVDHTLTQSQFDALVSFTFNCGAANLLNIARRINRGDYDEARNAIGLYVKSKGEFMRGLQRRREGEQALWDGVGYPAITNDDAYHAAVVDDPEPSEDAEAKKGLSKVSKPNPKSAIMPLYRPKQSEAVTRAVMHKFRELIPEDARDDSVAVLFVRGYFGDSMGAKGKNDRAMYDDAAFVVAPDGVQPFNANTDPAVFRKAVATIKANQAVRYKPGLHGYSRPGGPYPAFRQDADCTVDRDDVGPDTGMFHCNLHKGAVTGTSSLGCLTIPPHQWDEFRDLVKGLLQRHDQSTFYALVLEYDGDKPPVSNSLINTVQNPGRMNSEDATSLGLAAAIGMLIYTSWTTISETVTNLPIVGGLF